MAEFLNRTEVKGYALSNGETADLIALIDTNRPNTWTGATEAPAIGTVAYVWAMGDVRRGVVTKTTKTKTYVTFTTQGAVTEADRYHAGNHIRVQTTAEITERVYVAPAAPVETPAPAAEVTEEAPVVETPATAPVAADEDEAAILAAESEGMVAPAEHDEECECWKDEDVLATPSPERDATGSGVVRMLEKVWARIRADHPELPSVVMITGSGLVGDSKWGHFRANGWKIREEGAEITRMHELFMAGETLAKGARQVLQTMLHEGAHTLARVRDLKDTSRQGRWHNQTFRKLAEEMGLEHKRPTADSSHGFSFVTLTEKTADRYADLLEELDREIHLMCDLPVWLGGTEDEDKGGEKIGKPGGKKTGEEGSSSNNLKLTCRCEEPNIIRASRKVADKLIVRCDDCGELFENRA